MVSTTGAKQDTAKQQSSLKKSPGARGIGFLAKNRGCARLAVLVTESMSPNRVSRDVFGVLIDEGQSPMAIQKGNRFDARMSASDGEALLQLYRKEGILSEAAQGINLGERYPGNAPAMRKAREDATMALLGQRSKGEGGYALLLKPLLSICVGDARFVIEPDYLVAREGESWFRVGEMKSYADRGGQTDPRKLKSACMQSAVGHVALQQWRDREGIESHPDLLCDLVLVRPNSMTASLRELRIAGEVLGIEEALAGLPALLAKAKAVQVGDDLGSKETICSLPYAYEGGCRSFCGLANVCRRQAWEAQELSVLGAAVRHALGDVAMADVMEVLGASLGEDPAQIAGEALVDAPNEASLLSDCRRVWERYKGGIQR